MKIRLNGKDHGVEEHGNVETLITMLKLDSSKVAVELNGAIVPRLLYSGTVLSEGDAVEIVRFIGGG